MEEKAIIQLKCGKCGSKASKIGGTSWPRCCGTSMSLDVPQVTVIDPHNEYLFLGRDVVKIDIQQGVKKVFNPYNLNHE